MNKLILSILFGGLLSFTVKAQVAPMPVLSPKNPWTDKQLIEPAALASAIKAGGSKIPLIYNIGVVEDIPGAQHIGAASKEESLQKLKKVVAGLPKNKAMVVYCGCCPFAKCPNIRPAFSALTKMGFTNVKLLNLATNLQTDWISKGYPLAKKNRKAFHFSN